MNKLRKTVLALSIAMIAAVLCEMLIFNFRSLRTVGSRWEALPEPEIVADTSSSTGEAFVFHDVNSEVDYIHLYISVVDSAGKQKPAEFVVYVSDEGNAAFYRAGTVSYTQNYQKESFFRLNAYGAVKEIKIEMKTGYGCICTLETAEINGDVPFFVSIPRLIAVFLLLSLLYAIRPSSSLYDNRTWDRLRGSRTVCVVALLVVNILILGFLTRMNTPYVEIPESAGWDHHHQYAKLARALADGRTYIETPEQEERELVYLAELEDPYDRSARNALFAEKDASSPWDTAYFNGHLYVYFGVVPVVLAYLPYYAITGNDLSTAGLAVFTFGMILVGAFLFMRSFIRRYFPGTPFVVYVLLSLLLGNCTCAAEYTMVPGFYVIPITFSTAFVYYALALWISAARRWELALSGERSAGSGVAARIAVGALFAALVAGCRPQFLIFSVLAFPIFWGVVRRDTRRRRSVGMAVALAVPYVVVAAALMYYNFIRFGSVFDFGANYNLTTNNMPLRGWNLSRLPDGLFEYLFRLPNIDLRFPYVQAASTGSPYVGMTIRESMFGGVLVTNVFLWIIFFIRRARGVLREKRLFAFAVIAAVSAVAVIAADTLMAGILWRYTGDFLPLLYVSAAAVFLSLYHSAGERGRRALTAFLIAALFVTVTADVFFGITDGSLKDRAAGHFYMLRNIFS